VVRDLPGRARILKEQTKRAVGVGSHRQRLNLDSHSFSPGPNHGDRRRVTARIYIEDVAVGGPGAATHRHRLGRGGGFIEE
jgi:hypothetical protein